MDAMTLKEMEWNEEFNDGSKASVYVLAMNTCHRLCIASRMAETRQAKSMKPKRQPLCDPLTHSPAVAKYTCDVVCALGIGKTKDSIFMNAISSIYRKTVVWYNVTKENGTATLQDSMSNKSIMMDLPCSTEYPLAHPPTLTQKADAPTSSVPH